MKSKFLVGTGLIMIAAAVFLMICNVSEERKAGETAEKMVIQMESLEAELPERLTSESEELVPEYKKNPEMEMPTVEINGQECIGTLEIPSLLFDIIMPVMNGLEATKTIRKIDRADAATIPIIAMSANAFEKDIRGSIEAGLNAHLVKPMDGKKMIDIMRRFLASKTRKIE